MAAGGKASLKGAWSESREYFLHKFRHKCYQRTRRRSACDYTYDGRARRGRMHKLIIRWSTVTL